MRLVRTASADSRLIGSKPIERDVWLAMPTLASRRPAASSQKTMSNFAASAVRASWM